MIYGPCGGVRTDGGCEVPGQRCSFVDLVDSATLAALEFTPADVDPPAQGVGDALPSFGEGTSAAGAEFAALLRRGGVITADLNVRSTDPGVLGEAASRLTDLTAVVAGEPPSLNDSLSPAHKALVLSQRGLRVVAGITCRDRNRVALEGELAALADIGVSGVLAVTGDHPATTVRPDATSVFDLDSTRLVALARRAGLFTAVAEQPAAPPLTYRARRLEKKTRAGAGACFLNLCGGVAEVSTFVAAAQAAGVTAPLVASVPILASDEALRRLGALPGALLPSELATTIDGSDLDAAIDAAADLALALSALPGVAGAHLSVIGTSNDPEGFGATDLVARTAELIRTRATPGGGS